jgi:diaminopimelate dehydrogenase
MKRARIAIIGFGRLGRACAEVAGDYAELVLAGIVRRNGALPREAPFRSLPVVSHVRDLHAVNVALVCVPATATLEAARELLQHGIAIVECAALQGKALGAHHDALARIAARYRSSAVMAAGWDPGVLTLLRGAFEMLVPHGVTEFTRRPAARLHHTVATDAVSGVRAALSCELPATGEGPPQRYVYVELSPGARFDQVQAAVVADPAFAGEETHVFAVDNIAALEAENQGVMLIRRGAALRGAHEMLLMEGRFDPEVLAARVMLDAARKVPKFGIGGHRYCLSSGS